MKEMKRILSLVLCFVMLVGMMPAIALNADAAEGDHYLMFATDRHANTSVIGNIINNMESAIGENQLEYLGLGGDMVGSGNTHPEYDSSEVLAEATNATSSLNASNVDIVAGIHDMNVNDDAGIVLSYKKGGAEIYEGDDYYVYGVEEYCISDDSNEQNWVAQADAFEAWANSAEVDPSKVIIVLSHYPLHANRDDNDGAMYWHWALNAVATGNAYGNDTTVERDILFFHGHNHTVDQNEYVYNVGDTMSIQNGSKTESAAIYYTYATAGYLNQNKKATLVTINDETITLTKYGTSGSGTAMATVKRYVTETPNPTETTAPEATTPVLDGLRVCYSRETLVGEELALTVYAVYTDGSEVEVEDYTVSGYDPDATGAQGVIVTYENQNYGFNVVTTDKVTVVADGMASLTVTNVTDTLTEALADKLETGFVAYDIVPNAYNVEKNIAVVSMPAPEGADAVYYWNKDTSELEPLTDVIFENGKVIFTTNHFSTYVVGAAATTPNDGTATVPGNSSTSTKEVWKLTSSVTAGTYLIVNTNAAGSGYALLNNNGTVSAVALTVVNDGTNTYIELDNANAEWTLSANASNSSYWDVKNGNYYLGHDSSWGSYYLTLDGTSESWSSDGSNLYFTTGNYVKSYYYLTGGSSWSLSSRNSEANVYFYAPATITTTTGTQEATYGINILVNGTAASTMNANNVVNGDSVELGTEFTSTVSGQQPSGGSYAWTTTTSNGVASVDANGLVTFTGKAGTETIKVSYTWTVDGVSYTISNTLTITTTAMSYSMNIVEESASVKIGADLTLDVDYLNSENEAVTPENVTWTSDNETVATVAGGVVSGVAAGDATITAEWTDPAGVKHTDTVVVTVVDAVYALTVEKDTYIHKGVKAGDTLTLSATLTKDDAAQENPALVWEIVSGTGATINKDTGVLTFDGTEGEVKVKVSYVVNESTTLEQYITVHIHKSTAITPEESTTDFPRWPNPGAVRFDKTAQAVGNFSNTGVAQMELSLAGIPMQTGGEADVVLMLDMTGSMDDDEMAAAEAAAKSFADQIIKKSDGTFNTNRIAVYAFNSGSSSPYELWAMSAVNEDTYADLTKAIESASNKKVQGGTPYDEALSQCRTVLQNTKTEGRAQYCVFVSDGAPTAFEYITGGTSPNYTHTGWSHSGQGSPSDSAVSALTSYTEYYSTMMKEVDGVTVYTVGTGLTTTSNANALAILENIASDENKAYVVEDGSDTSALTGAFKAIAAEITAAASQIEVTDKITEEYEMIFDWPDAVKNDDQVAGQEFYIEVVNYALDETTHERNGNYDVLTRIYLTEDADGNLSISKLVKIEGVTSTSAGTETELTTTPAYAAVEEGKKGYFNLVDGNYVYVADGSGAYNMTEGATVSGTADNVVLHTPYFSYDASTKVITWHITETSDNKEIALRYFLYLTDSLESASGDIKEFNEDGSKNPAYVPAGTYPTNEYATLEYINHLDHECLQYFPEPQLTWNGAQVSYVFYLVNSNGEPVNTAGRVVTFAEAVFVTKVYTQAVVWNDDKGVTSLEATRIASALLPDDYELYDDTTKYEINVYQDEKDNDMGNHFIITAGGGTTKVYNTKSGTKYSNPGTYDKDDVHSGFDFANTTVAFAVVWERKLVPDTVVVDFGLPVDINVTTNDFVYNAITAIGNSTPNSAINTGLYSSSALENKVDATTGMSTVLKVGEHTAQVINENVIRFTPGSMEFPEAVKFHYETKTEYYEENAVKEGYLYSSVTVVPATTIYYEDEFVELKTYTNPVTVENEDGTTTTTYTESNGWTTAGTTANATQAQDRPGESQITDALDADNNYGYDAAYSAMSKYSLGSAAMVNVTTGKYATAQFTFYGTGFDVISMTSNTTGTLTVKVVAAQDITAADGTTIASGTAVKNMVVDTYYGYTKNDAGEWVATPNTENALYQVPVIKAEGLNYGKYTVTITASYVSIFDHTTPAGYDLYLDAIRIYDPANDGASNKDVEDAYKADGEGWPSYIELRNKIISAEGITTDQNGDVVFPEGAALDGPIFIDGNDQNYSIADYVSYGPNNELYLAKGQRIAFQLGNLGLVAKIQLGIKSADGKAVTYTIQNITSDGTVSNAKTATISTATDMYYDITGWKDGIIVITNSGDAGIISLTNIKATYTQNPNGAVVTSEDDTEDVASESNEVYTYMTPAAATMTLRALNAPAVVEPEETEPETTEPETTEPETTEPETTEPETTEPETTEPETTEPETTEPEATEPEEKPSEEEVVREIVKGIIKIIGRLFGRWF